MDCARRCAALRRSRKSCASRARARLLMPVFRYKAVNSSGGVAMGELEAANESEIVERLRDQGLMPTQVARAAGALIAGSGSGAPATGGGTRSRWFASKKVNRDQLLAITRELATLL